jgi:hypothetical protein
VYYSKTRDNPFLPESYIENLKENLDPKQALRMLEGLWVEIDQEVVYYNYKQSNNYLPRKYEYNKNYPIDISHDFNIGDGKPMSLCISQHIDNKFHFAKTHIIEGARTTDILDEVASTGLLDTHNNFRIFGDSSGKSRDTRSIKSDYDIIRQYLENYERPDKTKVQFQVLVPLANPPIRERHNLVNAQCQNINGDIKLFVYEEAKDLDEGFRLTKLKKGGNYIEDDSFRLQHVTTAAGYMINYLLKKWREVPKSYRR